MADVEGGLEAEVRRFAAGMGLRGLRCVGSGVEALVFRATGKDGRAVAVRVPRARVYRTANNVDVDAAALLDQDARLGAWLAAAGVPVAEPLGRHTTASGLPLLITRYVEDDGGGPDWGDVGRILRVLHTAGVPPFAPVLQYGLPGRTLIPRRLSERYGRLRGLVPSLRPLPPRAVLESALDGTEDARSVLHLDVRRQNYLCRGGRVRAVLDWSNMLVGDPRLELARIHEYAFVAENGIDEPALLAGYGSNELPTAGPTADLVHRLDAAVMLALVFTSVQPRPDLARPQLARVSELVRTLHAAAPVG